MPTVQDLIDLLKSKYGPEDRIAYDLCDIEMVSRAAQARGMDRYFTSKDYDQMIEGIQSDMTQDVPRREAINAAIGRTYLVWRKANIKRGD